MVILLFSFVEWFTACLKYYCLGVVKIFRGIINMVFSESLVSSSSLSFLLLLFLQIFYCNCCNFDPEKYKKDQKGKMFSLDLTRADINLSGITITRYPAAYQRNYFILNWWLSWKVVSLFKWKKRSSSYLWCG